MLRRKNQLDWQVILAEDMIDIDTLPGYMHFDS